MNSAEAARQDDRSRTFYLYRVSLVAALGGFLFGYDLSLISGAILFLEEEFALSPYWVGMVTGSAILGCPFGPLCGMWLADNMGRWWSLMISGALFFVSAIGSSMAPDVWQLILWRFVGGMGVGLASTISPMYISEIAPAHLRGRLVVVNQLSIVIGLTLAVLVTYFLSFGGHWRLMFASQAVPVLAFFIGLLYVPRSPRWLAMQNRNEEALAVLTRINGEEAAIAEMQSIRSELGQESGGFREFLQPGVLTAIMIGVVLMVFSQINGVNMILLYTPTLFMKAGISSAPDAILNSVIIDVWIVICTVIAFWLTRQFGRRPILIWGAIGMAFGHFLMYLNFAYELPLWLTLAAMFVPTGAFTLTLAPLSWVVVSELYPNRVRGKAMSLATCAMFTASFITVQLFPSILEMFTTRFGHPGATFLLFVGVCLACSFFVWRWVPETKDQSLEQIGERWLNEPTANNPLASSEASIG